MNLETIWYEVSPYMYTVVGVFALANSDERIGQVSGVLLLGHHRHSLTLGKPP